MPTPSPFRSGTWLIALVIGLAVLLQGSSTLRWGDGLELVAVASQAGVAHPPGYPLFIGLLSAIVGLTPADPYASALWWCRILGGAAAFVLAMSLRSVLRSREVDEKTALGTSLLGALAFLFGGSLWPALHVVEVYGLNALLVALILWLLVHRDPQVTTPALWMAAVVQGLALSHHLTSASLLPLTVLAIGAHARAGGRRDAAIAMSIVLLIPILLYASLLGRAPTAQEETIVWGGMQDAGALLRHVFGSEYGSSQFLMADPHTRFSFGEWMTFAAGRIGRLVQSAGQVVAGPTALAPLLGLLATAFAIVGARDLLRRRRGPAIGVLIALALQTGFVITYNIADIADYFLAIHVLALPLVYGGIVIALHPIARGRTSMRWLPFVPLLFLVLTLPLNAKVARPVSGEITARYQSRLLGELPVGAALVTAESGDLFLMWYTRFAGGARRDLVVVPANLLDRPWIRATLPLDDPRREALGFRSSGMETLEPYVADLRALVLEPLFDHGRVFTTLRNTDVLEALARHYEFRMAAELLRRDELELLRADDLPRAPAVLWELRRRAR